MTNVAAPFGLFSADAEGLEKPSLQVLEVNLTGIIYGIKIFLHHIRKANAGEKDGVKARIVITGSEGGFYPLPYDPVYCASKHGVRIICASLECIARLISLENVADASIARRAYPVSRMALP